LLNEVREKYADRIIDEPPISESAVAAIAIGAAMKGSRTLAQFGLAAFAMEAWSQICNEAAAAYYQSGGTLKCPAIFTMMHGMSAAEHSQHNRSPYTSMANFPGLQIMLPSTPADMKGLMTTALNSDSPTVVMNHFALMPMEGEVPDEDYSIPFGKADVKREGTDITLVATSYQVHNALAAADALSARGVSAEVIDPRTIIPLDTDTIIASVKKTGRLAIVDESPLTYGFGAEIAALAAEHALDELEAPVVRISHPYALIPRGSKGQSEIRITPEKVVAAVEPILS
jgi:pyruvate dehydrogenase E1 component beta subunit